MKESQKLMISARICSAIPGRSERSVHSLTISLRNVPECDDKGYHYPHDGIPQSGNKHTAHNETDQTSFHGSSKIHTNIFSCSHFQSILLPQPHWSELLPHPSKVHGKLPCPIPIMGLYRNISNPIPHV